MFYTKSYFLSNVYKKCLFLDFPCLPEDSVVARLLINRTNVVDTMFEFYKNEDLLSQQLHVEFLGEPGIDAGGLSKELFTIFWKTILENPDYFKGKDIALPHVPLHLIRKKKNMFTTIGRILSHTILITKDIPSKLAGLTYVLIADKDINIYIQDILVNEFLLFLTVPERIIIQKALSNYVKLSSREVDRLTSLFTCYGYNDIPKQLEITEQITAIAEKALLHDTKELFEKLKEGVSDVIKNFFKELSLADIYALWKKTQPTKQKVMNCLVTESLYQTNEEEKTFFFLQNYVGSLGDSDLEKFLLFVTGSVNMPDKITVGFHEHKGLARRPIAHTCANRIDVGINYSSQQEFNSEFDIILKDDSSLEYSIL